MTDVSRLRMVRFGKHSADTAFTSSDSGSVVYTQMRPLDDSPSFLPRARQSLARNLRSLSGRNYAHVKGIQDIGDLSVSCELRGINSNTGAAVSDWEAKQTEIGDILRCMFGAVATATTGSAVTVAASGHTPASGLLGVSGVTGYAAGQVIAFATSAGIQVGKVVSAVTTTITLEHPYNGTPTTSATVFRCAVWTEDDDLTHHRHGSFSAEGENWRRDYFGCLPKSFAIDTGQGALVFNSVWSPSSSVDSAEANTAHAEPTTGNPIVADAINLWLAGAALIARDVAISYDNAAVMRKAHTATNGVLGGVCATGNGKQFKLEFSVYLGNNSLSELQDSTGTPSLNTLLGDDVAAGNPSTVREVSVQIGTEIGALMYVHFAEADVQVKLEDKDGLTTARVTCVSTGATPGIFALG